MHPNGVTSSLKLYDVLMNELVEPRGNASSAVPFPSQLKKDRCRCSRVTQGQVGGQQELLRARSGGGKNFDLGLAASQVTRNDAAEISKVIAEGNSNRTLGHGQSSTGAPAVLNLSDRRSRGAALLETNALDPKGLKALESSDLTLGYYGRGRGLADRVFADWSFADGPLTNWRGLDNRLRTREVRSNRRSYQSQRRSANEYKFQHEVPCR